MRRPFVTFHFALAVALAPVVCFAQAAAQPAAQQPTTQQPATQQPATQQPATQGATPQGTGQAAPATPATPKLAFTTPAGLLLVQIKPDQTAVFEEMMGKLKTGLAATQDATLKQQAAGLKVYKSTEPFAQNVLYVVTMDPTVPNSEYELFAMLQKTMTPDQLRAPETADMWKRYAAAFAAGLSKLSLTPLGS
jgi:glucose/arabinose dehydrogenase